LRPVTGANSTKENMNKKLIVFASEAGESFSFYGLVNVHVEDVCALELAKAAVSDANREEARNLEQGVPGCDDGLPLVESIQTRLQAVGFDFIDAPITIGPWETVEHGSTFVEARLRAENVQFSRKAERGEIVIPTAAGDMVIDAAQSQWRCANGGASGTLKGSGFGNLVLLVQGRGQPAPV
jgi:hypothetical protein